MGVKPVMPAGSLLWSHDDEEVVGYDFAVYSVAVNHESVFLSRVMYHDHVCVASHGCLYGCTCSLREEVQCYPGILCLESGFYGVVFYSCLVEARC